MVYRHIYCLSIHVEDNSVTNIFSMNKENCALKLVDEIIPYNCMYKSSLNLTLGCSKHVEDTTIKLNYYCKKCAFCRFLLHMYITMHVSRNVNYEVSVKVMFAA